MPPDPTPLPHQAAAEPAILELLVRNSQDFIGIADLQGMPLYTNDAAMRIVGAADLDEMRAKPVIEYFVPEDREFVELVVLPAVLREGRWVGELRLQHFRTGVAVPIVYDIFLIRDPATGEPRHYATISRVISEQKALEQALRENAERLGAALDAAGAGTFRWDITSNALTWDDSLDRLFGLGPDNTARSLEQFVQLVHPDDRAEVITRCTASRDEGADFEMEFRVCWPDGSEHWLYDRGETFCVDGRPAYMTGACVDITRRKAIEAAAKRSADRLQLALDATGVGTWDFDPATGVLIWDERCRALFGVQPDERLDYAFFLALVHEDDRERTHGAVNQALAPESGGSYAVEYRTSRVFDGAPRWILATGRAVFERGAAVRFIGTAHDVTQRKEAERALQDADRRKSEFLAILAHELRNPLAPIRNGLEALRFADDNPRVLPTVRPMMERQLTHMVRLIDDLMDLSRINHGKIELNRKALDLARVVRAAVDASMPLIQQREHHLALQLPTEPVVVDADDTRLVQVISNLLNNAANYTPPGGQIAIGVRSANGVATVSVRDTGFGIPPDMQKRIFESFTRMETHAAGAPGGLGIGLSICSRLVQMHGGTIEVKSAGAGKGSEFIVSLAAVSRRESIEPATDSSAGRRPRRIIVADDNADAAEALKLVLEVMGHEVRSTQNGRDVAAVAAEFQPDIVLLDIGMPDMDGYEVCRTLRGVTGIAKQPLIAAVTGWSQAEDKAKARTAGFDHHLVKPVDLAALNALFSRLD